MNKAEKALFWFRKDLRLQDNPGLAAALARGPVLPIFIHDTSMPEPWVLGQAARLWLYLGLNSLNEALDGHVNFYEGVPNDILKRLAVRFHVTHMMWNRLYDPASIKQDAALKATLKSAGVIVQTFNASLLWEPSTTKKPDGTPYKVFTSFFKKSCLQNQPPRGTVSLPKSAAFVRDSQSAPLKNLACFSHLTSWFLSRQKTPKKKKCAPRNLVRNRDTWPEAILQSWKEDLRAVMPSELGNTGAKPSQNRMISQIELLAQKKLRHFLKSKLAGYKEKRDFPASNHTSGLSPFLAQGNISPHQIWQAVLDAQIHTPVDEKDKNHFLSELGWREFSYTLLYHNPEMPWKNLNSTFDTFPWTQSQEGFQAWTEGQTGYPFVDAGMRQLRQTGVMHNRLRMVTASFLVKHLLIDWRLGQKWFWDNLIDADCANNSAGWQWVAGCGADAAPYFRIFNPITQGEKNDPGGLFTRQFVPELSNLPNTYLFAPFLAPASVLQDCGIQLGKTYPQPIINLSFGRQRALSAFATSKKTNISSRKKLS